MEASRKRAACVTEFGTKQQAISTSTSDAMTDVNVVSKFAVGTLPTSDT